MTIVLLVEGDTEAALKTHLKSFLDRRAAEEDKPSLRLETRAEVAHTTGRFRNRVRLELERPQVTAVVALVDVFPNYANAAEARAELVARAGAPANFYAHAAQHDVEAWLLPFWNDICRHVNVRRPVPGAHPEQVNHERPPAYRLAELYRLAQPTPRKYKKVTEMYALLRNKDLTIIATQCPEFKAFVNTLLSLGSLTPLP
jgi:hypothetical protein